MNKLSTIIVDDEPNGVSTLRNFLARYCPNVAVLGDAASVSEAARKIKLYSPQLVFLDINMPGADGFELLEKMEAPSFHVVFVTAYDDFALKAFKYHAVNYLLKPVNIDELIESVARVEKLVASAMPGRQVTQPLQTTGKSALPEKLALPVLDGLVYVDIASIIRCEAEGNYTVFYFTNRPKMIVSKTLGGYEKQLEPHGFFRVHHHHLINLAHLEYYQRGRGGLVKLSDKKEITVSQRRKDEFLRLIERVQE